MADILYERQKTRIMPQIECYTDSSQLHDAVHILKQIEDRRLQIDMGLLLEEGFKYQLGGKGRTTNLQTLRQKLVHPVPSFWG